MVVQIMQDGADALTMLGMPFEIGYECLQFGHIITPSTIWI